MKVYRILDNISQKRSRVESAISIAPGKMNILLAWLEAIVLPSNSTFFAGLPPAKIARPPAKSVIIAQY